MQLAMSQIQAGIQASTAQPLPGGRTAFELENSGNAIDGRDAKALNDMKSLTLGMNDQTRVCLLRLWIRL